MVEGRKQTQHVPKDWLPELERRVRAGREFQSAVRENQGRLPLDSCGELSV